MESCGSKRSGEDVERRQGTHQPMKPYKRVVFDKLRNLKAESPSKNDVSGTILLEPPASRLNHPFGMTKYYSRVIHKVFRSRFAVFVCLFRRMPCQQRSVADEESCEAAVVGKKAMAKFR